MKKLFYLLILSTIVLVSSDAYAHSVGAPFLWLSTDPNNFDEGGVGYVDSAPGWKNESYCTKNMPFTMYL